MNTNRELTTAKAYMDWRIHIHRQGVYGLANPQAAQNAPDAKGEKAQAKQPARSEQIDQAVVRFLAFERLVVPRKIGGSMANQRRHGKGPQAV